MAHLVTRCPLKSVPSQTIGEKDQAIPTCNLLPSRVTVVKGHVFIQIIAFLKTLSVFSA